MEKYNLVVTDVKPVGQPDQYGNLAFNISFEGGLSGFFKCKEQDLFQVGVASEFYIEKTKGSKGIEYNKIRRISSVENTFDNEKKTLTSGHGGGVNKEQIEQINRSVSIKAACHLLTGSSNNTPERVLEAAEIFNDYIQFGITDKQPANVAIEMKKVVTDELPWD